MRLPRDTASGSTTTCWSATASRRSGGSSRPTSARAAPTGCGRGSSRRSAPSRTRTGQCFRTSGRTEARTRGGCGCCSETRVQLEPIFLLYDRAPGFARPDRAPDIDVGDSRLWRLEGEHGVEEFFDELQLLIADGHHRYETAVAFAQEDGADRMLVVLVSTSDPGVDILPTHRVFSDRPDIDPDGEPFGTVEDAVRALNREPPGRAAAVAVLPVETRLVRGEEGELDVELVDRFGHEGISYTADRAEAERRVRAGEARCAFVLREPRIDDVFARAREGKPLPPKTTYFFPKLVSGLLFHPVDP